MKPSALDTLIVAKSILNEAKNLIEVGDRHLSTAGIIILQDFVELVILALLDELDVANLESKSFDELLGELKKKEVPIVKSGTIKALNKQRVICKHYGQLCEPVSVVNYLSVALQFADSALQKVYGKVLHEIFAADVLNEGVLKVLVSSAIISAGEERFLESLQTLRKAFFIAYEGEYCVYGFRNNLGRGIGWLLLEPRGHKAPEHTRKSEWIANFVKTPCDYVQVDVDRLKNDCLEWGVSAVEVENFRRLTPRMVELENDVWHCDYEIEYAANELNQENFSYCVDVLLGFLIAKQRFEAKQKWPKRVKVAEAPPVHIGKPMYVMPLQTSDVVKHVPEGYYCQVLRYVGGFIPGENYLYVSIWPMNGQIRLEDYYWGYLLVD
ncbi:hypothetical protein [Pseudomonas sp. Marseille-P9899]|uniref:hypothetical protein n=1 Tax=Pseudomonas sp. Marseille-P9899 TaxID=2730401 RepID=UPI001588AA02|nr:hypothetical protein [Pseudomonas sp. Marseille-P9899]